jgi:hypothetical protein
MSIVNSFIPRFSTYFLSSGLSPCVMERAHKRDRATGMISTIQLRKSHCSCIMFEDLYHKKCSNIYIYIYIDKRERE